jgi:cysteine desulfurase
MPYFDHNATTPMGPAGREAWLRAADEAWHNPSSPYRASARVHRLLDEARERLAGWVAPGARGGIVFTSGATEANNAVIAWAARHLSADARIGVPATEHPSVVEPVARWFGERVVWLGVDAEGRIDPGDVRALVDQRRIGWVVAMAANNETGVLGPVAALAALCAERGVPMLCDASQWAGRLPLGELPASAVLVGSAHKCGGPKGTGWMWIPEWAHGFRGAMGGGQERGHRAGTENYPAVASMVAALAEAEARSAAEREERAGWRDAWAARIVAEIPGARVNAAGAPRLWNTLSLRMPAHEHTRWVARLDREGFQVSTGSACATGSGAPSRVLAAMGLSAAEARRTIRVSAGWETTAEDWRGLEAAIVRVWRALERE